VILALPAWGGGVRSEMDSLLEADREMSRRAGVVGLGAALVDHLGPGGVVLPADGHPIVGREALKALLRELPSNESAGPSAWSPLGGGLADAGDLGYTYGRFDRSASEGEWGYYVALWRRAPSGDWVLAFSRGLLDRRVDSESPEDVNLHRPLSADEHSLVTTERAFARHSVAHGMAAAFCEYMADSGLALAGSGPPQGRAVFCEGAGEEAPGTLAWEPIFTCVSRSGDLGYNFGPYEYDIPAGDHPARAFHGYFMTVWRRQADGQWRFLIDGGNQCSAPLAMPR